MSGQYNTMRRVLQGSCDETTPSRFFVMSLSAFMLHYSISFFSPVAVCRPDHAPSLPQTPAWRHAPIEFGPVLVWSCYFHLPRMCARFIESLHLLFLLTEVCISRISCGLTASFSLMDVLGLSLYCSPKRTPFVEWRRCTVRSSFDHCAWNYLPSCSTYFAYYVWRS